MNTTFRLVFSSLYLVGRLLIGRIFLCCEEGRIFSVDEEGDFCFLCPSLLTCNSPLSKLFLFLDADCLATMTVFRPVVTLTNDCLFREVKKLC